MKDDVAVVIFVIIIIVIFLLGVTFGYYSVPDQTHYKESYQQCSADLKDCLSICGCTR